MNNERSASTKSQKFWKTRVLLFSLLIPLTSNAETLQHCTPVPRSREVLIQFQKLHPCPSTGLTYGSCPGWIKDHKEPLCLTGQKGDVLSNLQWMTVEDAKLKDIWEREACRLAGCQHRGD